MNDETAHPADNPFDTADEAGVPAALADVVKAGKSLERALEAYRTALMSCRTPLNLKAQFDATESLHEYLQETGDELVAAQHILEHDVPLSPCFNPEGPKWFGPGKAYATAAVLTPRQLVHLARLAERDQTRTTVSYREAMQHEPDALPALIAREQDAEKAAMEAANKAVRRENYWILVQDVLDDLKTRPCPYCEADAGSFCVTSSGAVCDPHTGRIAASSLAGENPGVRKSLRWGETPEEWRARTGQPAPMSTNQIATNRALLNELVTEVSEMTRPKY